MTTNEKEKPTHVSAVEYIRGNFHPSDRIAVLVRNGGTNEIQQRIMSAEKLGGPRALEWLLHKNEKESCDIYIGMNPLKPEAHGRTKDDIQTIRHLYLDIDDEGPAALGKILQSNLVPGPNYTINTSPDKYQVVWRVEGIEQDQAENVLRAMARKFGGDPAATDSTRVLRLPGFLNKKYAIDFFVKAEKQSDRIYHLSDFRLRSEPVDTDLRLQSKFPSQPRDPQKPLSQSECDWMYAKRALARGDDPEEVIRRISDYRGDEKHSNYARYTVQKAQALVSRASANAPSHETAPDRDSI